LGNKIYYCSEENTEDEEMDETNKIGYYESAWEERKSFLFKSMLIGAVLAFVFTVLLGIVAFKSEFPSNTFLTTLTFLARLPLKRK